MAFQVHDLSQSHAKVVANFLSTVQRHYKLVKKLAKSMWVIE